MRELSDVPGLEGLQVDKVFSLTEHGWPELFSLKGGQHLAFCVETKKAVFWMVEPVDAKVIRKICEGKVPDPDPFEQDGTLVVLRKKDLTVLVREGQKPEPWMRPDWLPQIFKAVERMREERIRSEVRDTVRHLAGAAVQ